jgi:hypothetical protein
MRAYRVASDQLRERIDEALAASAGASFSADAERRRHITTPTLMLLRALAASPGDFDAALVAALEAHKA